MKQKIFFKVTSTIMAAVFVSGISMTVDARGPWTTVGSAGTVHEYDVDIYGTSYAYIYINSPNDSETLNVRYNIVSVEGLYGGEGLSLSARFRDNGEDARIILRLRRVNLSTGSISTMMTFDSDNFTPSTSYQYQRTADCSSGFDFYNYAYYIDAYLMKYSSSGSPALGVISISPTIC